MSERSQVKKMAARLKKAGIASRSNDSVADSRERLRSVVKIMGRPSSKLADVSETRIEGPEGSIRVRVYRPKKGTSGDSPLTMFFHGGGWYLGGLDTSEEPLRMLSELSAGAVVSVDYRLAPEHPFPAGLEDCYIATVWAQANARALGCDPGKVVVSGESAGGNLAAATAILARERKSPRIAYQVLVYPNLDITRDMSRFADSEFGPTLAQLSRMLGLYLPKRPGEAKDPLVSPLLGKLRGLPPALIFTAEEDPLREQDEDYAKKLRKAGVKARVVNYPGAVHGFWNFPSHFASGDDAVRKAAAAIRRLKG